MVANPSTMRRADFLDRQIIITSKKKSTYTARSILIRVFWLGLGGDRKEALKNGPSQVLALDLGLFTG